MDNNENFETKKTLLEEVVVINMGIEEFYSSLITQNIPVVHISWQPENTFSEEIDMLLNSIL